MNSQLPDQLNPQFIFSMTHSSLLLRAIEGHIDLMAEVKRELASRGMDQNGAWIGFKEAKKFWGV